MPIADPMNPTRRPSEPESTEPRLSRERALPERATPNVIGHIPGEERRSGNPRLNNAAEKVGGALGTAVSGVRGGKQRFEVIRGGGAESAKSKLNEAVDEVRGKGEELVGRAREAGDELADRAREKGEELAGKARRAGDELRGQAQVSLEQARWNAERMARTHPLHFIAAAALFGVATGVVLRLWRDHAS